MPYTAQDLVAQARAAIEEIDPARLRALQAAGTPLIDVREPGEFAVIVADAAEQVLGRRPEYSTTGGTSDARFIKDYCPVAEFGLIGQTMHKVDERVAVADIRALAQVYEAVLERFFAA